jgi:hypothetical protein
MTRTLTLAALFLLTAPLAAQPTQEPPAADAIHMPEIVTPAPAPPVPPPGTVPLLADDVLYLITSPSPFFVLASPPGLVTVTYDNGPQTIRGRFVESPTKKVTRRITDKYLAIVEAVGVGRVELIVVPSGVTSESAIIRRLVDCQVAPIPPPPGPTPVPPGPVPPTPTPAPIPGPGLHALVVYETGALSKLPAAQVAALYSKGVRDYMRSKSIDFRFYDADVDMAGETQLWKDAMKIKRDSLPWLILSDGVKGYSGPFPANTDETIKLLKTIGG